MNHTEKQKIQTNSSCCSHDHHEQDHSHDPENAFSFNTYLPATISFIMLLIGIALDNLIANTFFKGYLRLFWYILAYLPVGIPVLKEAYQTILKGQVFTEFLLMSLAAIGAFAIGEYPEGVAVMLFYTIGELFQAAAVNKARGNIKALLDVRPDSAEVYRNEKFGRVPPEKVAAGETIQVRAGEKVPLDGTLLSESSSFNTSALTGESKPRTFRKGEEVMAGMLNLDKVITLKVTKIFKDSALARILEMVQHATSRKAKTELFIRRFAAVYTPIVFFLALALVIIPFFIIPDYQFRTWLYRALVFLVISCPCALVISIPLGYFGGIGAASSNGILFKGSNFLDIITRATTVVLDKTGTLTHGVFNVQKVETSLEKNVFLSYLAALEAKSTHPIAKAIVAYYANDIVPADDVEEIAGLGLKGSVNGKTVLAGNTRLLKNFDIAYPSFIDDTAESIVVLAVENQYAGYVLIADELKEDARETIRQLKAAGIKQIVLLSGDKSSIVQKVAETLGIETFYGDLLPADKVSRLEELQKNKTGRIIFVGDGINDAPVLALSDVGIAMGAMGSDAAIETADVVIQTDQPSKMVTAINIGKATKRVVIQNITLAFAVKIVVLILGAGGLATMWEAVFADVGVALLAILNAVRIQKMKF